MDDNIREKKEVSETKEGRGGGFKLLVMTNIITFLLAGFIGPNIQRTLTRSFSPKSYEELKIEEVESFVKDNYLRDVEDVHLSKGKLRGMLGALNDPYSQYLSEEEFSALLEDTHGAFGGIGVVVSVDLETGLIIVVSPVEDTPAEKAGIRPGDYIVEIDNKPYDKSNYLDGVKAMKGEIRTDVEIKLIRNLGKEGEETKKLTIKREEIRVNTVSSEMLNSNIGYIRLTSFDDLSFDDFKDHMKSLESKGMDRMIIDLRNNPGGLLNITADIANLFLDKGVIVSTETKKGKVDEIKSDNKKVDYPLVVLVNEGSASASEILSGALKDRKRATIVGSQTFGKGVVQRIVDLKDGTGLKLTVSEYTTPNGTKIDGVGVTPDIIVPLKEGVEDIGPENLKEDNQLKKAIEEIKKK